MDEFNVSLSDRHNFRKIVIKTLALTAPISTSIAV